MRVLTSTLLLTLVAPGLSACGEEKSPAPQQANAAKPETKSTMADAKALVDRMVTKVAANVEASKSELEALTQAMSAEEKKTIDDYARAKLAPLMSRFVQVVTVPPNKEACGGTRGKVPDQATAEEMLSGFLCSKMDEDIAAELLKKAAEVNKVPSIKIIKADIGSYYGKDTTLVGYLQLADYYNYKYRGHERSHYSFEFTPFKEEGVFNTIYAYGRQTKFRGVKDQLINMMTLNFKIPYKVVVTTDRGHRDKDIWTLKSAEPWIDWWRGRCCLKQKK